MPSNATYKPKSILELGCMCSPDLWSTKQWHPQVVEIRKETSFKTDTSFNNQI